MPVSDACNLKNCQSRQSGIIKVPIKFIKDATVQWDWENSEYWGFKRYFRGERKWHLIIVQ